MEKNAWILSKPCLKLFSVNVKMYLYTAENINCRLYTLYYSDVQGSCIATGRSDSSEITKVNFSRMKKNGANISISAAVVGLGTQSAIVAFSST